MNEERKKLFQKFLAGQCSEEEVYELFLWVNSDEAVKEIDAGLDAFSSRLAFEKSIDSEKLFEDLKERVNEMNRIEERTLPTRRSKSIPKISLLKRYTVVAASVAIAISFWVGLHENGEGSTEQYTASSNLVTKKAESGQKVTTMLPDGTTVKLNSASSLEYSKEEFIHSRMVRLEGEAFFDVVRDETNPFQIIMKDGIEVKVLGTSFVVKSLDSTGAGLVAVKSGKVEVKNNINGSTVALEKGDFSKVEEDKMLANLKINNEDAFFGWVENRLVFDQIDIEKSIGMIETWFGVEVRHQIDFSNGHTFTARFDNPTKEYVLESFCHAFNLQYEMTSKNEVTLRE